MHRLEDLRHRILSTIDLVEDLTSMISEVTTILPSGFLRTPGTLPAQTPDPMYTASLEAQSSSRSQISSIRSPTIFNALS